MFYRPFRILCMSLHFRIQDPSYSRGPLYFKHLENQVIRMTICILNFRSSFQGFCKYLMVLISINSGKCWTMIICCYNFIMRCYYVVVLASLEC